MKTRYSTCTVDDCNKEHYCKSFCKIHYQRWYRTGKTTVTVEQHGGCNTPTYISWSSMIARCELPSVNGYESYGGRGIKVCPQWRNSFTVFLNDMGSRPPNMSIDRLDNDKGYEPGNCKWSTASEQQRNKRLSSSSVSGHKHISWGTKRSKWIVCKRKNYLGSYILLQDAVNKLNESNINDERRGL